jgi:hypothetical protein
MHPTPRHIIYTNLVNHYREVKLTNFLREVHTSTFDKTALTYDQRKKPPNIVSAC